MDFTAIIKTVAPWIGTALAGPFGGMAMQAACSALGISDGTTEALKQTISGVSPEQMLALKDADQQFAAKMKELGFANVEKLSALEVDDRKSAREMNVETRSNIPAVLSVVVTVGYFAVLIGMMAGWFRVAESTPLMLMLGSLTTAWVSVLAFWFGTTSSSGRKTELLAKAPAIE